MAVLPRADVLQEPDSTLEELPLSRGSGMARTGPTAHTQHQVAPVPVLHAPVTKALARHQEAFGLTSFQT